MIRGRARKLSVTTALVAASTAFSGCSGKTAPTIQGSFTVRVLTGSQAEATRHALLAKNESSPTYTAFAVVSITWTGHWHGDCGIRFAELHPTGWRIVDFAGSRIGGGVDASVPAAFAKYPSVFAGIPQPDERIGYADNEDTFGVVDTAGTSQVTYAIDAATGGTPPQVQIAGEVACGKRAAAAARLGQQI